VPSQTTLRIGGSGSSTTRLARGSATRVDVTAAGLPARDFALRLLAEERVAVAPGAAFGPGGEGCVRVSLAASEADLVEVGSRLAALWDRLRASGRAAD
jgi:aspartate/methionine/tyrosine aminotransferase